jgi:4-hydroxybenzoate polyprenyltransferase
MDSIKHFSKHLYNWAELIKVEHTVFALPFALSGFILASNGLPQPNKLLWTIIAFTGARAAAMSLNRAIDAEIDARNPRTQSRAIPQGIIKKRSAIILAIISFVVMIFAASQLNFLCVVLSSIAIIWLSFYSYSKRFSALCHFALGIALGGAALGGWIAAGGNPLCLSVWFLASAVTFWVTGFDIIYACQDCEFDAQEKLFSLPSKIGIVRSLNIARLLHILTVLSLIFLGMTSNLGFLYWLGVSIVAALLFYEHTLVNAKDLSKVNAAFFNTNGIISITAFVFILLDHLYNRL